MRTQNASGVETPGIPVGARRRSKSNKMMRVGPRRVARVCTRVDAPVTAILVGIGQGVGSFSALRCHARLVAGQIEDGGRTAPARVSRCTPGGATSDARSAMERDTTDHATAPCAPKRSSGENRLPPRRTRATRSRATGKFEPRPPRCPMPLPWRRTLGAPTPPPCHPRRPSPPLPSPSPSSPIPSAPSSRR